MIKNTEFRAQYATVESLVIKWDTEKTTDAEVVADMQHFKRPIIAKYCIAGLSRRQANFVCREVTDQK